MSLKKRLALGFILAVLGSILLTSLISNYMVGQKFKDYLINEHEAKVENIVKIIDELYSEENYNKKINTDEIQRYAELQDLYIEVKDLNNETIYSSGKSHLQHKDMMGNMMMGSIMRNMSGFNMGEYTENKYPLQSDTKVIGNIIVGYFGTSYLSNASISFIGALNRSFIISAIIAIIFGLFISIVISRQISRPLAKITETANKIKDGNLNVRAEINTNTKEIYELCNSINYLAETLNSQEMLRKRLTSDMAHELRTPLTTLKTHVEAFIDGIWEPTSERLQIFYEEIERLSKMVENLKDLAKLEQIDINLNKSKVNISREIEKIIDTYRPLFMKENYELSSEISPEIIAVVDIDKFKQIINNLISNAYKYLKSNGKVMVTLEKQKQNIIIKISDTGIGIPKEDLPYIYERFYRSDLSRNKKTGGAGIGLTITKAFVEAHGGKIIVESTVNKGSAFIVELPEV